MKNKIIHRAIIIILIFIAIVVVAGIVTFIGLQGLAASDPAIAIIMGRDITGTVKDKDRSYGYSVIIDTDNYGEISISCSVEKYKALKIGDKVDVTYELTLVE